MKIRIVCYEDKNAWILGKFSRMLCKNLNELGHAADIEKTPDSKADINHHVIYYDYDAKGNGFDSVMITHIDTPEKVKKIQRQLEVAQIGICMSSGTVKQLVYSGIPRSKLAHVNPAQDGIIKPRKLKVGILCKTHQDGRKKQHELIDLARQISFHDYKFVIMGAGWNEIVNQMRELRFEVEYYEAFNYDVYVNLVPSLDYFMSWTFDEGTMAYLDALSAGVKTIVSPQGYHSDAIGGIVFPVNSMNDVIAVLRNESANRASLVESVSEWTWSNYTKKHLDIWNGLLGNTQNLYFPESSDGFSTLKSNNQLKDFCFKLTSPIFLKQHYKKYQY